MRTAVVVFAAVLLAVALAVWCNASGDGGAEAGGGMEEKAFHFLHGTARGIRWTLMGVLLALTAYVAVCNAVMLWTNCRRMGSHSLVPVLGAVFGIAAFMAAPGGSVWRWVAAGVALADPGTWLALWSFWAGLRHFAGFVAGGRARRGCDEATRRRTDEDGGREDETTR